MPAQPVAGTVAVLSNTSTQPFDLCNERVAIEIQKAFVHVADACKNRRD
jgi:hypothetical protein